MADQNPAYIAAVAMDHDMVYDPSHINEGRLDRWTCIDCGRAAVSYDGAVYGLALEGRCPRRPPLFPRREAS